MHNVPVLMSYMLWEGKKFIRFLIADFRFWIAERLRPGRKGARKNQQLAALGAGILAGFATMR